MQKSNRVALAAAVTFASGLLLSTPPADAAPTNLGFENGNSIGWTSGGTGLSGATDTLGGFTTPAEGGFFGYVQGGDAGVYTTLSQTFDLTAGEQVTGYAGFRSNDALPDGYNDDGYVSFGGVVKLAWDVAGVGNNTITDWVPFTFTAPTTGSYTLEIGARNLGDNQYPSGTVLDGVAILPVPEPAAWALMLVGFGGLGAGLRRRRTQLASA